MSADTSSDTPAGPLDVTIAERIATLTLNRPAAGNAIDLSLARALLAAAICAVGAARALLLESFGAGLEHQLEREARSIAAAARGAEFREGVAAFLERRKPDFEREAN